MDMQTETKDRKQKAIRPLTVRIEDFKEGLQRIVAESELPPFLLEMILGEYLAGISTVARQEYAQCRQEWEEAEKGGEEDGRHQERD